MATPTWKYITEDATRTYSSWTNKQRVQFQYFNENGLYHKWLKMCVTITQYIDAGIVPNGWDLAYGTFSDFHIKQLTNEFIGQERINTISLKICLEGIQRSIDTGYIKLGELHKDT